MSRTLLFCCIFTCSVDVVPSLEDSDVVTLADTLNGGSQTSKTSSDDENIDAGLGVRSKLLCRHLRLRLEGRVVLGGVRHVDVMYVRFVV